MATTGTAAGYHLPMTEAATEQATVALSGWETTGAASLTLDRLRRWLCCRLLAESRQLADLESTLCRAFDQAARAPVGSRLLQMRDLVLTSLPARPSDPELASHPQAAGFGRYEQALDRLPSELRAAAALRVEFALGDGELAAELGLAVADVGAQVAKAALAWASGGSAEIEASPALRERALAAADGHSGGSDEGERDQIWLLRRLDQLAEVAAVFRRRSAGPPSQWGHLRIDRRIGEGAFGEVYCAHDTLLHRDVALKLQHPDRGGDPRAYIDEARRLARVRHPNVLAVHGADIHEGWVGIWADLLRGETLAARLGDSTRMAPAAVLELAGQLAAALQAAHGAGLCHGDVKPANIMCEADGRYVLMDFGAARETSERDRFHYGTPRFMSPERLRGDRPPSVADDVFAVGVVLYRAALGRYPERRHGEHDDTAGGSEVVIERWALRRQLGMALAGLITELLQSAAERRPSADQLRERYYRIVQLPQRRRRRFVIGTVIASLAAGLLVALQGLEAARDAERQAAAARERAEEIGGFLRRWLAAPTAEERGRQVRVLDVLSDAEQELTTAPPRNPQVAAELRLLLAETLARLGEEQRAGALIERVLADAAGLSELQGLQARYQANALAADRGDADALERQFAFLRQLEAGPHAGSELHVDALLQLAIGLINRERLSEAETYLGIAERLLQASPAEHRALTENVLRGARLSLLSAKGNFRAAAELAKSTLDAAIARHGAHHSAVLLARGKWVEALAQAGRFAEAEAPARENFAEARSWLGEDDRYTLAAVTALGNVLDEAGRHGEALEFRQDAWQRAQRINGLSPSDLANIRINLANSLKENGRRGEAIEHYRAVIAAGDDASIYPVVLLMARSNLTEALVEDGRYAEAEPHARDTLRRMQETLDAGHPFVGHAQAMWGAALTGLGRAAMALPELQAAAAIVRDSIGEDNSLALDIGWYHWQALCQTGADDSQARLAALQASQQRVLGEQHPDSRRSASLIAARSRQPDRCRP